MSSSSLVTSSGLPPPIQGYKHLPAAVLPTERCVRVVAVLLDAFFKFAARVVLDLHTQGKRVCLTVECRPCCGVLDPLLRSAQRLMSVVAVKHVPDASRGRYVFTNRQSSMQRLNRLLEW